MTDGYDYDFMIADWDNDILTITRGSKEYEYSLSAEMSLWEGGVINGVDRVEIGQQEDKEDTKEDKDTDEYYEDYDNYDEYRYNEWDAEFGWLGNGRGGRRRS